MIQYSTGAWSIQFLFQCRGSVFPKALVWAFPAAINAVCIHYFWYDVAKGKGFESASGVGTVWSSFTFVLGFLIVFRTQQAYTRYWEGATLVQQARANFFNASSSVVAFCTSDSRLKGPVEEFQHLLVRLMSMLHCVGLQTVADGQDVDFEFFNTAGLDPESLLFLSQKSDRHQRCEIVIQWIQRLVIDGSRAGILDVPAPILTRSFQELSQGVVHIINARNMTGIPFPFPYAQLLTSLLIAHWGITPFFCSLILNDPVWASIFTFLSVFAFWGANYIAAEIESPFGDDANDLPLHALQQDMNRSLWILLHPRAQAVPHFSFNKQQHRKWDVICQNNFARLSARSQLKSRKSKMWTQVPTSNKSMDMSSSMVSYGSHRSESTSTLASALPPTSSHSAQVATQPNPSVYSLTSRTHETLGALTSLGGRESSKSDPKVSFTIHSDGVSATRSDLSIAQGYEILPPPDLEFARNSFQLLTGPLRNSRCSYRDINMHYADAGFDVVPPSPDVFIPNLKFNEDGEGFETTFGLEKSSPSRACISRAGSLPVIIEACQGESAVI